MLTQKEVKADILQVITSLENDDAKLASPLEAFKLSCLYQTPCALGYLAAAIYMYFFVYPAEEFIWGALAIIGVSLFLGLITYGHALAFVSLPHHVREKSVVINRIKSTYLKTVAFFVIINLLVAITIVFNQKLIICAPIAFMIGFFAIQIVLGMEMARYGVSTVMEKSAKLLNKI